VAGLAAGAAGAEEVEEVEDEVLELEAVPVPVPAAEPGVVVELEAGAEAELEAGAEAELEAGVEAELEVEPEAVLEPEVLAELGAGPEELAVPVHPLHYQPAVYYPSSHHPYQQRSQSLYHCQLQRYAAEQAHC